MTKVLFDNDKIESSVIPKLDDALKDINSAISIANSLSIPSFGYSSYLYGLASNIKSNYDKCIKVKNTLNDGKVNFTNYVDEGVKNFSKKVIDDFTPNEKKINLL